MEQQSPTKSHNNTKDTQGISDPNLENNSCSSPKSEIFLDQEDDKNDEMITPGVTKVIKKLTSKKKYHNISNELRRQLIEAVETRGEKVKHAAKKLNINYSSAKSICQVFKREGRSHRRSSKRKEFKDIPEISKEEKPALLSSLNVVPKGLPPTEQLSQASFPSQSVETDANKSQDSLLVLRDRLLGSRGESSQQQQAKGLEAAVKTDNGMYNEFTANPYGQSVNNISSSQVKQYQQAEPQTVYLNQHSQVIGQPLQSKASFVMNNDSSKYANPTQTIYIVPQNPMGPMIFSTPQSFPPNNFNPIFTQNVTVGVPTQTININQPQAKNMNIQSISVPGNNNTSLNNPPSFPTSTFFDQKTGLPQNQQSSYYILGYQNIPENPMNTMQTLQMQSPMYFVPQNNVMTINSFPQTMMNNMTTYGMPSHPNYSSNYISFQPGPMYLYANGAGYGIPTADQKFNEGQSSKGPSGAGPK